MKALYKHLSVLVALSLITGCGASGSETEDTTAMGNSTEELLTTQADSTDENILTRTDSTDELFLSLTEGTSKSLSFSLTKEQAAQVEKAGADKVTWTLHRTAPDATCQ